jgi:hypothetical protein
MDRLVHEELLRISRMPGAEKGLDQERALTTRVSTHSFSSSLGVVRVDLIWSGESISAMKVLAKTTLAARERLAASVLSVTRACLDVCQGHDGQKSCTTPLEPSSRNRAGSDEDPYVLHYGSWTLHKPCHWKLFEHLCSIVFSPAMRYSEEDGKRLTPESILKGGIWTLAQHAEFPFATSVLPIYLGVLETCLGALYTTSKHKWSSALGLDANEESASDELFTKRNHAMHRLDTQITPLECLQAWLLARFALYQLGVKLCPAGRPVDEVVGPAQFPRRRQTFGLTLRGIRCDFKHLLRLACIGA